MRIAATVIDKRFNTGASLYAPAAPGGLRSPARAGRGLLPRRRGRRGARSVFTNHQNQAQDHKANAPAPFQWTDPTKRRSWERGVEPIESYRQEHGITDRDNALGIEPQDGFERAAPERRENRLREIRRDIGHEHHLEHPRELGRGMGIGR